MQNRPASGRTGLWQRLPVIGRLLIAFWAVLLTGGAGATAFLLHQRKPLVAAKTTKPVQPSVPLHDDMRIVSTSAPKPVVPPAPTVATTPPTKPPVVTPDNGRVAVASLPPPSSSAAAPAVRAQTPLPAPEAVTQQSLPPVPTPEIPTRPETARRAPVVLPIDRTAIAIVLQGFGYSDALTYDVISRIPAPVAVGISPYIGNVSDIIARAHASHREVYVTLPMQSAHPERVDEGPHALGYGNSAADDQRELEWCLSRATGAEGLTDASENGDDQPGGGYATSADFSSIANIISSKGLLYLAGSAEDNRRTRGMTATTWIDGDTDASTLDNRLSALLPTDGKPAKILLMIGPVTPVVIDRLSSWLKSPAASNFVLVPPSAFADDGPGNQQTANIASSGSGAPL
ncbi:divergent polysaccharide deacetylase family protein [Gluconobacter kanchanaburiensis]|uniref:divergent polysaccharide deacetylase family protein n=1 Tax=Gluconobacter kanchanaburiensis TaxID=563199 RepID=UPI0011BFA016|nr:divergent polysaccharide deacetylase family protein [Gluconobacter kanchanaburiensis]MBF0861412.1 divergent polysaccharide deacetylase family protein [Gluconobacter kanchanaburiensis]